MINVNLTTLEAAVDNAEAELGISDRLFGMLNRLSFFVSHCYFHNIDNTITWFVIHIFHDMYFRKKLKNLWYLIDYQCTSLQQFIEPMTILRVNE